MAECSSVIRVVEDVIVVANLNQMEAIAKLPIVIGVISFSNLIQCDGIQDDVYFALL